MAYICENFLLFLHVSLFCHYGLATILESCPNYGQLRDCLEFHGYFSRDDNDRGYHICICRNANCDAVVKCESYFDSRDVGMAALRPSGFKIDFVNNSISGSAS